MVRTKNCGILHSCSLGHVCAERGKDTSTGVGVSEAMVQYRVTTLGQEAPELAAILAGAA